MAILEPWSRRPTEEANLFNPPFLCALTHEFLKTFAANDEGGASIFLVMIAMTTVLHSKSREKLPNSTVTALYAWVQANEELLIGFASRAKNVGPFVTEAIMFGLAMRTLKFVSGSQLSVGERKATFPKSFLEQTTVETRMIVERSRFMGRWLGKSGSETSIAALFGVRP